MKRLVYMSFAVRPMTDGDLADILGDARNTNQPAGVTGLLLYHNGAFLQCLEGDDAAVDRIHAKIGKASQHRSLVTLLEEKDIGQRLFPNWSMGFEALQTGSQLAGFRDIRAMTDGHAPVGAGTKVASVANAFLSTFTSAAGRSESDTKMTALKTMNAVQSAAS